ncbi:macrophage mannose receptor 1-like [Lineus longissimus]|uniref:macrophage mannose receptor 1-like n=1 Tax=Lineus longissimus TaxID=88925 RepID=UPI002B4E3601
MDVSIGWISGFVIFFALTGSSEALPCLPPSVIYEPSREHRICYTFNNTDVLGETADASCKYVGGHAVQIYNADIFNFLKNIPSTFFTKSDYWVGIKPPRWIWVDRNDSLNLDDEIWASDRPDMTNIHRRRCVASDANGWIDADCEDQKGFLCEKAALVPSSGDVCDDHSYTLFNSACYKHYSTQESFFTAKKKCKAENTTLARLDTKEKVEKLLPVITTISSPVWFGLFVEKWTWVNGNEVAYLPWKEDEPKDWDKQCVIAKISDAQAWTPESCSNKKGLLCEHVHSLPCSPNDLKYTRRRGQKISQKVSRSYSVAARSIMDCVTICTTQHGCLCTAVEYSASSGECMVLPGAVVDVNTRFVAATGVDTMIILN